MTEAIDLRGVGHIVRSLPRAEIQALLERWGFAVFDSEPTDDLADAVVANVGDGTIPVDEIRRLHSDAFTAGNISWENYHDR